MVKEKKVRVGRYVYFAEGMDLWMRERQEEAKARLGLPVTTSYPEVIRCLLEYGWVALAGEEGKGIPRPVPARDRWQFRKKGGLSRSPLVSVSEEG